MINLICINQDDREEKSTQLPLMGEIYSRAKNVYIWLGDGTAGTDRAMQYLNRGGLSRYFEAEKGGRVVVVQRLWAAVWKLMRPGRIQSTHPVIYKSEYYSYLIISSSALMYFELVEAKTDPRREKKKCPGVARKQPNSR